MIAYFDTSALLKLVLEELGTRVATLLWDTAELPYASRLAYPEARAAMAAAHRAGRLSGQQLAIAKAGFESRFARLRVIEVTTEVARSAGAQAEAHALRGYDAVHLASALILAATDLVMVTWDRDLARAAATAGLAVSGIQP